MGGGFEVCVYSVRFDKFDISVVRKLVVCLLEVWVCFSVRLCVSVLVDRLVFMLVISVRFMILRLVW